jgi:transcriptional regulator with PAS, ATPase and Fis domain
MRDLYFKIGMLPVVIPPLRERKSDIPLFAEHFLKMFSLQTKKPMLKFSETAIETLCGAFWAGNIRELKNRIEHAVILSNTEIIGEDALLIRADFFYSKSSNEDAWDLKEAVHAFKTAFVRRALEAHNWHKTKTARSLKIERTYLSKILTDFNIHDE